MEFSGGALFRGFFLEGSTVHFIRDIGTSQWRELVSVCNAHQMPQWRYWDRGHISVEKFCRVTAIPWEIRIAFAACLDLVWF